MQIDAPSFQPIDPCFGTEFDDLRICRSRYCDSTSSCYQCSYITRSQCDEISGGCCDSAFIINCGDRHGCQCSSNADCNCGSYCSQRVRTCQACDFAHRRQGHGADCDSVDGDCCSEAFHDRCPASIFACPDDPSAQVDCHLPNFAAGCACQRQPAQPHGGHP